MSTTRISLCLNDDDLRHAAVLKWINRLGLGDDKAPKIYRSRAANIQIISVLYAHIQVLPPESETKSK